MAGRNKWWKQAPGEPLETVIQPVLEVPRRDVFYARKVALYELGLLANQRMHARGIAFKAAGDAFLGTRPYWLLRRRIRREAGYRDDGSKTWEYLPAGYRERVQFNEKELLDAFWSGWYGYGMLDRGREGVTE
jgi:hypothetical protein